MGHGDHGLHAGAQAPAAFEQAREAERAAWDGLQARLALPDPEERRAALNRWTAAMQQLRAAQATHTWRSVERSVAGLRHCAQVLLPAGTPALVAPRRGQHWRGRDGRLWQVALVVEDVLEAGCYLAQLAEVGGAATVEVLSDDWALHCIAEGLRPVQAAGDGTRAD